MTHRIARAIRHVGFEDLGSFAEPLEQAGYTIEYIDAAAFAPGSLGKLEADLLVILGGPIGVGDQARYPVLSDELGLLRTRLAADLPTLGICLGAQLIAAALGARVYQGPSKEIGWSALNLTSAGQASPLAALEGASVLHWHGDTFDLPTGCELLASTDLYRHQAFCRGPNLLALQFHAEPRASMFEYWLLGHAAELTASNIDPEPLRMAAMQHADTLESRARTMVEEWIWRLR